MDVNYLGFNVEFKNDKQAQGFYQHLVEKSAIEYSKGTHPRTIFTNKVGDYLVALIITSKNQKSFCVGNPSEDGKLKISVKNLTGPTKVLDWNFLVLNTENHLGLYQHYHNSCALSTVNTIIKYLFRGYQEELINSEIVQLAAVPGIKTNEKKFEAIKKKHRGSVKLTQLVTKDSLASIIEAYKRVKWFEYEYTYLESVAPPSEPLSVFVKKKKERLFFGNKGTGPALAHLIQNYVQDKKILKGRVFLNDSLGEDHSVKLSDMPYSYGSEDYDMLAERLDGMDADQFHVHEQTTSMIKLCTHDHKATFAAKVQD